MLFDEKKEEAENKLKHIGVLLFFGRQQHIRSEEDA